MKKIISLLLIAFVLLWASPSYAVQCQKNVAGTAGQCWDLVEIASGETTLVSKGAVLVRDVNNGISSTEGAWRVRVASASAQGAYVAGIAQGKIATGEQALVLVRGPGTVGISSTDIDNNAVQSGDALWVHTSNETQTVSSTTQNQVGFALENGASGDTTIDAYITIL